jgi:hypothetical protein
MGVMYELDAIAAAVIGGTSLAGGVGRITGTVIGTIILGVMTSGFHLPQGRRLLPGDRQGPHHRGCRCRRRLPPEEAQEGVKSALDMILSENGFPLFGIMSESGRSACRRRAASPQRSRLQVRTARAKRE